MAQRTQKTKARITVDIPVVDHKKFKMLAAYYGTSMRDILNDLIQNGLENYEQCAKDHTPNTVTMKSIENIEAGKNTHKANSVDELFKKLRE